MDTTTLPHPGLMPRLLRRLVSRTSVVRHLQGEAAEPVAADSDAPAAPPLIYRRKPRAAKGNGRAPWQRDAEIPIRFQPALRRWLHAEFGPLAVRQYRRARLLPSSRVEELIEALVPQQAVAAGTTLYSPQGSADTLYFVRRGRVSLYSRSCPGEPIATITAGDFFGEVEVVLSVQRRMVAVASEETELFTLPAPIFLAALRDSETLREEIIPHVQSHLQSYLSHEPDTKENRMLAFVAEGGFFNAGKLMVCELDKCIDCHACEEACQTRHGILRLTSRAEARLGHVALPTTCKSCISPGCLDGCKKDAIRLLDSGRIHINDNCIGCQACAKGCHFGVISMVEIAASPESDAEGEDGKKKKAKKRAVKCDQCSGYAYEACMRECPTGALRFVDPVAYLLRAAAGV